MRCGCHKAKSPVPLGRLWIQRFNRPQTAAELAAIRRCVTRGQPFGSDAWPRNVARQHGLEHTFLHGGRHGKKPPASTVDASRK
jgi:putative transposase